MDEAPVLHEFSFSYKTIGDHLWDFSTQWLGIVLVALGVFGGLWTLIEVSIQFLEANPRGWSSYLILIGVALVTSFAWNVYLYSKKVPRGLENVSPYAQRIAHWQRPLWEFRLAKTLLQESFHPLDCELRDLEAGRSFVIAEKPENLQAYVRWAGARIPNVMNMLAVGKQLLLSDFPAVFKSSKTHPADPVNILDGVQMLARFYKETVEFERSSRAVMPSESLRQLHLYQFGWSEPIREGMRQMIRFLEQMCECNLNRPNHVQFTIVFPEAERVSEYCDELQRLESHIPELEHDW